MVPEVSTCPKLCLTAPAGIQLNAVWVVTYGLGHCALPLNPYEYTAVRLIRNESATVPTAIPPISDSEKRNQRPKMPLMAAPASGSRGTSQMYLYIDLWTLVLGLCEMSKAKGPRPKTFLHHFIKSISSTQI